MSSLPLLRFQFDLTWALLEYHLDRLDPADPLWEPAELCWTVREDAAGDWVPDWADTEPEPVPVPTIAWLTWHLGWWWTVTLDHLAGRPVRNRTEVTWPGDAPRTVAWLRSLGAEWRTTVDGLVESDLARPAPFPWADDPARTLADTLAWVNAELMKNGAEIGQLRLLRAARP